MMGFAHAACGGVSFSLWFSNVAKRQREKRRFYIESAAPQNLIRAHVGFHQRIILRMSKSRLNIACSLLIL